MRRVNMKKTFLRLVSLFIILFIPFTMFAQGITTASFNGIVVDKDGNPLQGANVTAVHEPSGTVFGSATRLDGHFNVPNVRVGGPYTLTVTYVGFREESVGDIFLQLGEDRRLDFTLIEEILTTEEVIVIAERDALFSASRTGTETNISTAQIENLPTITRSISDFTRLTPQVNGTGGSGATSVAGKNNRMNNFQVDGAVLNDVFGLDESGHPTGQINAQPISLDAIQEFQVQITPYDVRSGSFAGGLVNAITRSGTNQFTGSIYYFGRNERLVGELENVKSSDFKDYQYGFRIGGPLIQNKLFFFLSSELRRRDDPDNAGLADSEQPVKFVASSSEIKEIINISNNTWGYDPGGFNPFTNETNDQKIFVRLDYNISPQHRLILRHNYVNGDMDDGIDRNQWTYTLESNQFKRDNTTNSTVLQLNSTFGNNMANEARIAFTAVRDKRTPLFNPAPQVQINLPEGGEVRFGVERFSQKNALDQDVLEFTDNFHYFKGDHIFTVGTHNQLVSFDNLYIQDAYGAYEFDSIDEYEQGTPSRYLYSKSIVPGDDEPRAKWDYMQVGLYVQDEWKFSPTLNLSLGLRIDMPLMTDKPLANPLFASTFKGYRTNKVASGNILWSPRLGFNWDATGDRTTQVRGGLGMFAGLPPAVWLSNSYNNTGVDFARVDLATWRGETVPDFNPDPNNQPFFEQEQPPSDIAILDPDFKLPQILRANLAVDQQLPYGLVGTMEFMYGKNINEVFFKNLNVGNMGKPVGKTPDGRPDYGGSKYSDDFNTVILLTNTSEGYQWNATAGIRKLLYRDPLKGLSGGLYYTLNESQDINSGRSSRAISNWQYNETDDPNGETVAISDFLVRHRILGHLSYSFNYDSKSALTISLFYEGRSGNGFSYMYRDDANGDGVRGNDLAYIPKSKSDLSSNVSAEEWAKIDAFINSDDALKDARGGIFERNSAAALWSDRFDLRVAQKIPTFGLQNFEITIDIINVLNLLNSDWGHVKYVDYDAVNLFYLNGYDAEGKPDVSLYVRDYNDDGNINVEDIYVFSDLSSRWGIQFGIRYSF